MDRGSFHINVETADCVIVGAGIGGGVLANLLVRAGRRVVILERLRTPPVRLNPEILWPATVSMLQSLLPPARFAEWGVRIHGISMERQKRGKLTVKVGGFERLGFTPVSTDPNVSRRMLMETPRFDLRTGVEVDSLIRDEGGTRCIGVRARSSDANTMFEIRAPVIAADDGGHSRVRQLARIELPTARFPLAFILFRRRRPSGVAADQVRLHFNLPVNRAEIIALAVIPQPGDLLCCMAIVRRELAEAGPDGLNAAFDSLRRRSEFVADLLEDRRMPADLAAITIDHAISPRYGTDGVILLGDSAHPVSPAGGQGANLAVADGVAAAELILAGGADVADRYRERRQAAATRSIAITRGAAKFMSMSDSIVSLGLSSAFTLGRLFPFFLRRTARYFSTAFIDKNKDRR